MVDDERKVIIVKDKANDNISPNRVKLLSFSLFISLYFTARFLKKKVVFNEFNGHFNSPQRKLNFSIVKFNLLEGIFRFVLYFGAQCLFYNYYYEGFFKIDVIEPEIDYDSLQANDLYTYGDDFSPPSNDNIETDLRRRNVVNKYLNKNI